MATYLQMIKRAADKKGFTHVGMKAAVEAFVEEIDEQLRLTGHVEVHRLGVFRAKLVDERECIDPNNGKKIIAKPTYRVFFSAAKILKDNLNSTIGENDV